MSETTPNKSWTFTLNNYTDTEINILDNIEVNYIIYGKEVGENNTPHLQGFITFKKANRLSALKKILPRAHWEKAISSEAAINYCMKEGNFTKRDNRVQGKRNDLSDMVSTIRLSGLKRAVCEHPETFIKHHSGAEKFARYTHTLQERTPPTVYWLYGETGAGKTRYVFDQHKDLWVSSADLKWFDGYHGQEAALLDDFRPEHISFSLLLRLLDRYPIQLPVKGGFTDWTPLHIYITAPVKPQLMFTSSNEDLEQLLRRINHIVEVTKENYMTLGIE
ncbi:MAG: replication associated protein [Wigfec virus K19_691]|nr:MAG: replication associated protein [Wigfec virus K19_691]